MNQIITTQEDAEERAANLRNEGWTTIPYDQPEKGRKGILAFCTESDTEHLFQWEMFNEPLSSTTEIVTVDELVKAIQTETTSPLICDNPKKLLLGFVWYHPERNEAVIRQVSLSQIKTDRTNAQTILELRDRLRQKTEGS